MGILKVKFENNQWTKPHFANFSGVTNYNDDAPFISPDGKKLFFNSRRPLNENESTNIERIWVVDKVESSWSEPRPISDSINIMRVHMQFSISENGTLYFKSRNDSTKGFSDIYCSKFINDTYSKPVSLDLNINTEYNEMTPFISPDESYLLFARNKNPDSFVYTDLYISYRTATGDWTEAKNLGKTINTHHHENCPVISPDGKYLFFNSDRNGKSDIYWVDAKIIEELKPDSMKRFPGQQRVQPLSD